MLYNQLKHNPFFTNIAIGHAVELIQEGYLKKIDKGCLLFMCADEVKYFYITLSGWIKISRETFDGQEVVLGLATEGDMIGESNFNRQDHSFTAEAINDVELLKIPQEKLKKIVKSNDIIAFKVISALNVFINRLELQIEHATTMNAAQRIGCFIIRLCDHEAQGVIKMELPFDKLLIASYLGMKRETFSRGLKELKNLGIEIEGKVLTIPDIKKLVELSCVSCSLSPDCCKDYL